MTGWRDTAGELQEMREALRRSQEALRESEERFSLAARASRDAIWDWDLAADRIRWHEGGEVLGAGSEAECGCDLGWWAERIHPEDRERVLEAARAALDEPGSRWDDEFRLRRADGSYATVSARGQVARDADGKAVRMIGALTDVTRQRRAEEAVRRAQQLESLSVLAGGVAHDFNNLLMVILGRMTLGLRRLPPESPARVDVGQALEAGHRAAELADKLLTFSGGRHFVLRRVDPGWLVQDARPLWEGMIPRDVRLVLAVDPAVPPVEADETQLRQALTHLVVNAAEAMGDGRGTIRVATGVREVSVDDSTFWRHTGQPLPAGRYVSVDVTDDGSGLDPKILPRIFEPFFTTKFTGRGLGLSAVLGVARGHGGGVAVTSRPGRGSTFTLLLPVAVATAENAQRRPARGPGRTVLVIDDEPLVLDLVASTLEAAGFAVLTAGSGAEGVALFRKRGSEVGLVLLDLSMPGMDGTEVFQALRARRPDLRVLLTSGYSQEEATRRFADMELAGFVHKPCAPEALVAAVRDALACEG